MGFVHLHVHSQYSLLDGTADVDALVARAADYGMSALALTDAGNLFGAVAFYKACQKKGIKAILGAELNVQPEGLAYEDPLREQGGYQVIALVESEVGYRNLCALITASIFDGMRFKPRADLPMLAQYREGLVFLTGGLKGAGGRQVIAGDTARAELLLDELRAVLSPEQLYLELQDLGIDGHETLCDWAREQSARTGLLTVVTNAVHYLDAEDAPVHEALHAVSLGCSLSDVRRHVSPTDQAWLKPEAELRAVFPADEAAIDRTVEIAERCNFHFVFDDYKFPATTPPDADPSADTYANWAYFYQAFPPPVAFGLPAPEVAIPPRPDGAGNLFGYFRWYAYEGLKLRLQRIDPAEHDAYRERAVYELDVMISMKGFAAYLLIVAEFINWSKDNGIPIGPGRGSAAGSLVAWAMRITDIDPIRFGLLFERFLNPERVSMPDIDVDFCQDRREEAIVHVREKYGAPLVSQIITYGRLKAKAAVRDMARVLDLNFTEADRISKMVPDALGTTLTDALEQTEQLRNLRQGDPRIRRVIDLALKVENNIRQTGVHAAGVVIADRPLVEYAPLYRDGPNGGPVVQYDMKSAESIGLIKFDFLGLKTLDQIRDAVAMIEVNHGIAVDMSDIPVDDAPTYTLLQAGDALGVFQLESSGMRELLTRLRPNVIDDMVALVALYRPGPLQSGMVDDFVDRKHGRREVSYPLPILEPILKPTYGTIIYQEQVMEIARVMASYSLGGADLLRRAMGKKDAKEMDNQRVKFVTGSVANDIDEQKAQDIFDLMASFAAYGFNKSHSAAYGYISYQTAWLKTHYRSEYMAALMTIESGNTDKVLMYIQDCRAVGLRIEPVCVNRSDRNFSVPKPSERPIDPETGAVVGVIRFGLAAVKNTGESAIEAVLEARASAGGAFPSVFDLLERIDGRRVNKRALECLVKAGALDFEGVPRASLLAGLEAALSEAGRRQSDKLAGQTSLFAMLAPAAQPAPFRWPDMPEFPLAERLAYENEVLGLYLTGHPMEAHRGDVQRYASSRIDELEALPDGEEVRLLGLVSTSRTIKTRRGDKMAFVRLDDERAGVECVFFADSLSRSVRALESGEPVLVVGKTEVKEDGVKVRASSAETLSELRARTTKEVQFVLHTDDLTGERLPRFVELLAKHRGHCRARVLLRTPEDLRVTLELPGASVEPSALMEGQVVALFGRGDVVVLR